MIEPKEARITALSNPSFEKKVELYNAIDERIKAAAAKGERKFVLNEVEHLAIGKELEEKGYKRNPVNDNHLSAGNAFSISIDGGLYINGGFLQDISNTYNYYF